MATNQLYEAISDFIDAGNHLAYDCWDNDKWEKIVTDNPPSQEFPMSLDELLATFDCFEDWTDYKEYQSKVIHFIGEEYFEVASQQFMMYVFKLEKLVKEGQVIPNYPENLPDFLTLAQIFKEGLGITSPSDLTGNYLDEMRMA